MDTAERLKAVIAYVEKNITEEISLNYLANIACCSVYNFQHMFTFVTGISIVEYIRKRRMTLAGIDLQQNNMKVMDAAIKYKYNSAVSFARAFQAFHGVKASEAKKAGVSLKLYPRMSFQIYIKEFIKMEINKRNEILIVGCHGKNVGEAWGKWERKTEAHKINNDITDDKGNSAAFEVRFYPHNGEHVFVGVEVTQIEADSIWEHICIPKSKYAIFDIDHKTDQGPQYNLLNEWLNENKKTYKRLIWNADKHVDKSEYVICVYDHRKTGKYAQEQIMEMLIPIENVKQ